MITSKKYKFIFIHIPKTAGSSLNTALETLDQKGEESTRIFSAGGEFFSAANIKKTTTPYKDIKKEKKQALYFEKSTDFAHPYYPFNKLLCEERFKDPSYFSFSFVRNPFDRLVSAYTYASRRLDFEGDRANIDPNFKFKNFSEFCEKYLTSESFCDPVTKYNVHFLPQYRFIYEPQEVILQNGSPFVSYVGRFESLQEDFDYICKKIGVKAMKLPRVRDQKSKKPCSEYYSRETRDIVEEVYKRDLDLFNYDFPKNEKAIRVSLSDGRLEERSTAKTQADTFQQEMGKAWTSRHKAKEVFKYASQYIPKSELLASEKKENTSLNPESKIAIVSVNRLLSHSIESENSLLYYASKQGYAAHMYRDGETRMSQAILNHINDHEYLLYISDSCIIANLERKIEKLIEENKTKYIILDETQSAVLIKRHKYTENLISKWKGGSLASSLKASDPSSFNYKILKKSGFCEEPRAEEETPFILNFSNSDKNQKFFFAKMWNARHSLT